MQDEKGTWHIVVQHGRETSLGKLFPRDLRRTCAKLCRRPVAIWIQLLLGHASTQTTER